MTEETAPEDESSVVETKSTKLTGAQWERICTLWELGETKLSQITAEYGVSKQAVIKHFKKNGIVGGSRKGEIKTAIVSGVAAATVAATVPTFVDKRKQRIEDTREQHYMAATYLSQLTNKILTEALKASRTPASVKEDLKALRYASALQEQSFRIRMDVLNANDEIDEQELPTLEISDLTDQDIADLRNKQDEDDMGDDELLETIDDLEDEDDD